MRSLTAGAGSDVTPVSAGESPDALGQVASSEQMDARTRARLQTRLGSALTTGARAAGGLALASGRWLTDAVIEMAPHVPVRDLTTLSAHHRGLTGEQLADSMVKVATRASAAIGMAGGTLAAVEYAAPPTLLSAPAQIAAETLAVVAIELKLVAELHVVYGATIEGSPSGRGAIYLRAWARRRGLDPLQPAQVPGALGIAARRDLRRRVVRRLATSSATLTPMMMGAALGATLNNRETARLARAIRKDLRHRTGK